MLIDIFITLIGKLLNSIINLIPSFAFVDSLLDPIKFFLLYAREYVGMALWFFDMRVLGVISSLFLGYFVFTAGEYVIKLIIKYITRLL